MLQTLDSEQLEYAFQQHGISHDAQARRFYADLWNHIQNAEKIRSSQDLQTCTQDLRALCFSYFDTMRGWAQAEEERSEEQEICTSSLSNMREARKFLSAFEKQFYRYALCYLELNRHLIHMRARLSVFIKDYDMEELVKSLKVNHGTGVLLQQAHRERQVLMEKRLRLERVKSLLLQFDPLMESLGADLPKTMGSEGDRQLTLFKGALRKQEFDRAKHIACVWKNDSLKKTGEKIVALARRNVEELRAGEGLMLHSGELTLITAFLKADEAKLNEFMLKYNVPYMVFQYQNLIRQGYMLGRIGSIEALIIQHAKLLSLSVRPHGDADHAKVQERSILLPARDLMQTRFKTLTAIFDEMETTVAILEKLFVQTREYIVHTPADIKN